MGNGEYNTVNSSPPAEGIPAEGMVVDDGQNIMQASTGGSAVDAYPNPCGKWADVGNYRDAWCALLWIMCTMLVAGMGCFKLATGDVYLVPKGTTKWVNRVESNCDKNLADIIAIDTDSDGDCRQQGPKWQAVSCDDDNLYISTSFSTKDACTDAITSFKSLKDNSGTLKIPTSDTLPMCYKAGNLWSSYSAVTLESTTCKRSWDFAADGIKFVFVGAAYSFLFSVGAVYLCMTVPVQTIWGCNIGAIALYVIFCIVLIAMKAIFPGVICGLIAAVLALFLYLARDRIPFAAECLKCAATVVWKYNGLLAVAFGMLFAQIFFIVCWSASVGSKDEPIVIGGLFILSVVVFYWGVEVFKNIGHVTTAGVTADWFFSLGGPATPPYFIERPANPTPDAFKRATTWSLGPICFGSFIVAILQTIRMLCDMVTEDAHPILRCMVLCIIDCITNLLQYFNDYAYVQVAMFGKSYVGAAKDTWKLIKNGTGWDAIINDALIDRIFLCFAVLGALSCGGLCFLISNFNWTWFVVGLIEGFIIVLIFMKLIYSAVMTIFIGFWEVRKTGAVWSAPPLEGANPDEISNTIEMKYYHKTE
eukprot:TRINITY_DN19663_c0_g1_i1.p1 TRINITY_DN19663_c0_g1~~TRINITY_DN19663_c0_g1_i1.p1  ORF type:complete len:620 (+),score=115.06 TRINITY_DN19663_c0_g1_i1:93-1862(+)